MSHILPPTPIFLSFSTNLLQHYLRSMYTWYKQAKTLPCGIRSLTGGGGCPENPEESHPVQSDESQGKMPRPEVEKWNSTIFLFMFFVLIFSYVQLSIL